MKTRFYKALTIDSLLTNVNIGKSKINFLKKKSFGLGPGFFSFVIVLKIDLLNLRQFESESRFNSDENRFISLFSSDLHLTYETIELVHVTWRSNSI